MEKINCEIIKDLIPSYMDGICSDTTKQCVEKHIADCSNCRRITEFYKNNMLSGDKLEQKEWNGLKRINDIMKLQSLICSGILMLLIFLGVWVFFINRDISLFIPQTFLFIAFILVTLLSGLGCREKKSPEKREYLLGVLSFGFSLYFPIVYFHLIREMRQGAELIFGMELHKTGPFLERQLIVAFIVQAALFLYNLLCIIRQKKTCHWLLCLNMTGIFLLLRYDLWMKYMDSVETLLRSLMKDTLEVYAIGLLGILASILITRKVQKPIAG